MARGGHLLRGDLGQTGNLRAEPVVGKTLVAVLRAALHQVIHHDPVDEDLFGRNGAPFDNLIHLGNDNAAGVVDGGRHLKLLHVHGLIADGEVACLVPIGGAEEADIQGKGRIEQALPSPQLDEGDHFPACVLGPLVDLTAAVAGIGKGAQASGSNGAGQPPCNGLEEFHQIPQGEHVASRLFLLNQFP